METAPRRPTTPSMYIRVFPLEVTALDNMANPATPNRRDLFLPSSSAETSERIKDPRKKVTNNIRSDVG